MGYTITHSYGDHLTEVTVGTAKEAVAKAHEWEAAGEKNVRITRPDGDTLALRQFEIFSQGVKFGD